MNPAFATRPLVAEDIPFVSDSFWRSYQQQGHTHGIRDVFGPLITRPFRRLLEQSSTEDDALIAATVVYPKAEPGEIAGYSVQSPRHACLLYLLTKGPYAQLGVASHLIAQLPQIEVLRGPLGTETRIVHCFSTAAFSRLTKKLGIKCAYSPFLFSRLAWELQEDTSV